MQMLTRMLLNNIVWIHHVTDAENRLVFNILLCWWRLWAWEMEKQCNINCGKKFINIYTMMMLGLHNGKLVCLRNERHERKINHGASTLIYTNTVRRGKSSRTHRRRLTRTMWGKFTISTSQRTVELLDRIAIMKISFLIISRHGKHEKNKEKLAEEKHAGDTSKRATTTLESENSVPF